MTKINTLLFAMILIADMLTGCKKDNDKIPDPPLHEGEVITSLRLTFTDSANSSNVATATFKDPDGDGGNAPTQFDTIRLDANKTYLVSILLLDETKTPADTISSEVKEEANDHHFFFHHTGVTVATTYLDEDTNTPPLPLGLKTRWKTGNAGNGTSQVILKHQPGEKDGTESPGETDIDITFRTEVQ